MGKGICVFSPPVFTTTAIDGSVGSKRGPHSDRAMDDISPPYPSARCAAGASHYCGEVQRLSWGHLKCYESRRQSTGSRKHTYGDPLFPFPHRGAILRTVDRDERRAAQPFISRLSSSRSRASCRDADQSIRTSKARDARSQHALSHFRSPSRTAPESARTGQPFSAHTGQPSRVNRGYDLTSLAVSGRREGNGARPCKARHGRTMGQLGHRP
jgi:hypothetical protein